MQRDAKHDPLENDLSAPGQLVWSAGLDSIPSSVLAIIVHIGNARPAVDVISFRAELVTRLRLAGPEEAKRKRLHFLQVQLGFKRAQLVGKSSNEQSVDRYGSFFKCTK